MFKRRFWTLGKGSPDSLCLCYLFLFLTIYVRPIISKSAGPPTFQGLWTRMEAAVDNQSEIRLVFNPSSSREVAIATNFVSFIDTVLVTFGRWR